MATRSEQIYQRCQWCRGTGTTKRVHVAGSVTSRCHCQDTPTPGFVPIGVELPVVMEALDAYNRGRLETGVAAAV